MDTYYGFHSRTTGSHRDTYSTVAAVVVARNLLYLNL